MIDQQLAAVSEYKRAFADMTQATATREDARSKLGATADNAVARVAEVEKNPCCKATASLSSTA